MFSRMLRDGIEHVPPGLSAQAQRVAGGGTAIAAAQGSEAPDRGRSSNAPVAATPAAAGETAGATPGATASGTDGTTLAVAGDSAEADAAAFAREAGRGGNSAAAAADRAGAAEAGAVAGAGAGAGGAPGGGSIQGTDATAAASVAASDVLTSAGAQTRAGISAIAAVLGGNGKHALDAAGGAAQAPGTTPDPAGASAQSGAASASVSAASAASNAGAAPPAKIDIPVTSPEFAQAVASRVSYLVDNNLNGATLQVTPPQLGPIELRVTIEAGHAQVSMSAHNPTTLDALEAGAPKLRELLSAQGFGQVSVDVSQRSFQDGSPYAQSRPWKPSSEPDAGNPAAEEPVAAARTSLGMLDAYA